MKFLVVLALVGVASCAPAAEERDKRSFVAPFAPAGELVQSQTSEVQSDTIQSTNIQSNNRKSSSLKQSVYQPYQAPLLYPQPALYPTPQFEAVPYPAQPNPVFNYVNPQYAYNQPIATYPVKPYDLTYPYSTYNGNYYQPNYPYTTYPYGTTFNADAYLQPSVTYSSAAVPATVY